MGVTVRVMRNYQWGHLQLLMLKGYKKPGVRSIIFKDFVNQPGRGRVWGVWGHLFLFACVLGTMVLLI